MRLSYKGWNYGLEPARANPNSTAKAFWDLMFDHKHSDRTHCVGVTLDFKLKEIEQIAFKTIDKLVEEELKR